MFYRDMTKLFGSQYYRHFPPAIQFFIPDDPFCDLGCLVTELLRPVKSGIFGSSVTSLASQPHSLITKLASASTAASSWLESSLQKGQSYVHGCITTNGDLETFDNAVWQSTQDFVI